MNLITTKALTMDTSDLLVLVNEARAEFGEPPVRRNDFVDRCKDELEGEYYESFVVQNLNKTQSEELRLTRDQCMLVSMRESKAVRRKVVAKLNALANQVDFAIPQTRAEAMRLAADLEEQNAVLALENQQQAQTIASLESLFMTGETPTQFCKRLNGVNCSRVNSSLLALGWLWNAATEEDSKPRYRVASRVRDRYLTERPRKISSEGNDPFIKYDLILLIDGARRLHQLYMKGELAMKSKWDGLYTQAKYNGSDAQ